MEKLKKSVVAVLCIPFLIFLNTLSTYAETYTEITVEIPVICLGDANFCEIHIEPQNDAPSPDSNSFQLRSNKTGEFTISIDEPETYHYLVYQNALNNGIDYDSTVYDVTVYITSVDDNLQYSVTVVNSETNSKADSIIFKNYMKPTETTETATETVTKTLVQTSVSSVKPSSSGSKDSVKQFINSVLTGDKGVAAIVTVGGISVVIMIITLILKKTLS